MGGMPRFFWRDHESLALGRAQTSIRVAFRASVFAKLRSDRRPTSGLSYFHRFLNGEVHKVWLQWFLRAFVITRDGQGRLCSYSLAPSGANPHGHWVLVVVFTASPEHDRVLERLPAGDVPL